MFWFLGHEAYGILATKTGVKAVPLMLESEVLPTGLPGKSPNDPILKYCLFINF